MMGGPDFIKNAYQIVTVLAHTYSNIFLTNSFGTQI